MKKIVCTLLLHLEWKHSLHQRSVVLQNPRKLILPPQMDSPNKFEINANKVERERIVMAVKSKSQTQSWI